MHVFISHSSEDKPLARRLAFHLRILGHCTWLDQDALRLADDFPKEIIEAINVAEAFILVSTKSAVGSSWVAREVAQVLELRTAGKPTRVIPVLVGEQPTSAPWAGLHGIKHSNAFAFFDLVTRIGNELHDNDLQGVKLAGYRSNLDQQDNLREWYPGLNALFSGDGKLIEDWGDALERMDLHDDAKNHFIEALWSSKPELIKRDGNKQVAGLYARTGLGDVVLQSILNAQPDRVYDANKDLQFQRMVTHNPMNRLHAERSVALVASSVIPLPETVYYLAGYASDFLSETHLDRLARSLINWGLTPHQQSMVLDASFSIWLLTSRSSGRVSPLEKVWLDWIDDGFIDQHLVIYFNKLQGARRESFFAFDSTYIAIRHRVKWLMRSGKGEEVGVALEYCLLAYLNIQFEDRMGFVGHVFDQIGSYEWENSGLPAEAKTSVFRFLTSLFGASDPHSDIIDLYDTARKALGVDPKR